MPRLHFGWIIVAASLISNLLFGVFYSYGIFIVHLITEFGWSKAVAASVGSIALPVFSSFGLVMGWLSDRYGSRKVMAMGTVLFASAYVSLSRAGSLWQFYILFSFAAIGWGAVGTVPPAVISRWFKKSHGTAFGIALIGGGIGGAIMPTFTNMLIEMFGWRASFAITGVLFGILLAICSKLLYHKPEDRGLRAYGALEEKMSDGKATLTISHALKTRIFWQLSLTYFLAFASLMVIMVHLSSYALSQRISTWEAATAVSLVGGTSILGRICVGYLSDRVGASNTLSIVLALSFFSILPVVLTPSVGTLYLTSSVYGFSYGGWISSMMESTKVLFGSLSYGTIWGALNAIGGMGGFLGPVLAGYLVDVTGRASAAMILACTCCLLGTGISLATKRQPI